MIRIVDYAYFRLLFRSHRAFPLVATIVMAACNVHQPTSAKTTSIPVLNVSCEAQDDALNCRALEQVAASPVDAREGVDVTDAVVWTTSNASAARVVRGHVTSMDEPGSATITATLRAGDETVTASVLVVVGDDGASPQLAYDLSGAVRDVSNAAIPSVELTLSDDQGGSRIAVTGQNGGPSEGTFRFSPVLSGQYRLRAWKSGYRSVERVVNVPDRSPLTLVMLPDPR
jgi:Carboxypeptidase regulatory-like domain